MKIQNKPDLELQNYPPPKKIKHWKKNTKKQQHPDLEKQDFCSSMIIYQI